MQVPRTYSLQVNGSASIEETLTGRSKRLCSDVQE